MIKPGTSLCNSCGKTSTEHCYHAGAGGSIAVLTWKKGGSKLLLRSHSDSNIVYQLFEPERIDYRTFPPTEIQAYDVNTNNVVTFYRCCPHCGKTFLSDQIGRVHGYVIAVIGATDAGKTAWLGALSSDALGPVNRMDYPYAILPTFFTAKYGEDRSTEVGDNGKTNFFEIVRKDTGETAALVYLLDYGGENYKGQNVRDDTPVGRLLRGKAGKGYDGIDAAAFIESIDGTDRGEELVDILNLIPNLRRVPIAHILTHGDQLVGRKSDKNESDDPILLRSTFLKPKFDPQNLYARVMLQNHIISNCELSSLGGIFDAYFSTNSYNRFLVQSCEPIPGENRNNYSKRFNVVDPFLWLLSEMQLFPLQPNYRGG